jgi:prevent-host-death family protein
MARVGMKALKNNLSRYLRRVQAGERIVITDRGKPVAALVATEDSGEASWAWNLVEEGFATWSGGKPLGCFNPSRVRGKTAAEIVLENRL